MAQTHPAAFPNSFPKFSLCLSGCLLVIAGGQNLFCFFWLRYQAIISCNYSESCYRWISELSVLSRIHYSNAGSSLLQWGGHKRCQPPAAHRRHQMLVGKVRMTVGSACQSHPAAVPNTVPTQHVVWIQSGPKENVDSQREEGWGLQAGDAVSIILHPDKLPAQLCLFPSSLWIHDSTREERQGLSSDSKHQEKVLPDQIAKATLKSKSSRAFP